MTRAVALVTTAPVRTASGPPLRVVHVLNSFHPRIGGLEMQAAALAREQLARGYEVLIVTRCLPGLSTRDHLGPLAIRRLKAGPFGAAGFAAAGLAEIAPGRKAIDIVHAHSARAPALLGLLLGALGGPPLVVMLGGGDVPEPSHAGGRLGLSAVLRRGVLRRADAVVALTPGMRDALGQLGISSGRLHVIPNGIDSDLFRPAGEAARRAARAALHLPHDGEVVVFVGRLEPVKGPDLLLAAWKLLGNRGAWLLMAGDGSQRPALEVQARASERVRMLGWVEDQTLLNQLYQAADVAVVPSRSEGMGAALLEAMASGVAVVATAVGGIRETVEDGITGLLVEPAPGSLAAALRALLDDPDARARLGQAAARTIPARYSLKAKADACDTLYRRLLARRRR